VLLSLSLAMLLSSLGTSIANVALPTLAQVFAASLQHVQGIVLAYLLALTLAAYALAMTTGRGSFELLNLTLLVMVVVGVGLFALAETKATSPLIQLALFRIYA
jgi:hypothetical protein